MAQPICGVAQNLTATGAIGLAGQDAAMLGFYVNSTSSGTIVIKVAGSAVTGTITPAIGWHNFPLSAPGGLSVTIGGTLNVTVFFVPGAS